MIEQNELGLVPRTSGEATSPGSLCTFVTGDGVTHFARHWQQPGVPVKAILVYIHGIEGHSLWFDRTGLALAAQGIESYALDRRGAGLSKESRGHITDGQRLVADIEEIVTIIGDKTPSTAVFVMANCWGAKPAIVAAANSQSKMSSRISGLLLTSPAVTVKVDVNFATKLKIALSYLLRDEKRFAIPLAPEHFTDNPEYLKFIADDELRLKEATASFFLQSLLLTRQSLKASPRLTLPLLVLQSGRDDIVIVEEIEEWFAGVASADKTFEMFSEATHSLDFEVDPSAYQQTVARWILERAT